MREILPALSCACTEEEFKAGAADAYQTVYVVGNNGSFWKHVKLQGGGHFTFPVKSIPGEDGTSYKSDLKEELKFLPDGKIPIVLLRQIIKFFRQVMTNLGGNSSTVKHGELEAMAHILWHPDQGYFVGIPEQKVSKAAVSYDNSYIPSGAMVVVDIHSHNSMGAFFSGTDNRDDSRGVWISGVAGKLDKPQCELKWRFNYEAQKVELTLNDIFQSEDDVDFPVEWLEKVKREAWKPSGNLVTGVRGGPAQVVPGKQVVRPEEGDRVVVPVVATVVGGVSMYLDSLNRRVVPKGFGTGHSPQDWTFYDTPAPDYGMGLEQMGFGFGLGDYGNYNFGSSPGKRTAEEHAFLESLTGEGYIDMDELDDVSLRNLQKDLAQHALEEAEEEEEDEDEEEGTDDPKEQALLWLEAVDKDEELMEVLSDCYDRLSEKGKAKIAENGL